MKGHCPKVPQQPNFSDCGLYLLQYTESFFKDPIRDFSLPLRNMRSWFAKALMRNKREEIAAIIRRLHANQHPGKEIVFPQLTFSPDCGTGYSSGEEGDDDEEEEDMDLLEGVSGFKPTKTRTILLGSKRPAEEKTFDGEPKSKVASTEINVTEVKATPIPAKDTSTPKSASPPPEDDMEPPQKVIIPSIVKVSHTNLEGNVSSPPASTSGNVIIVKRAGTLSIIDQEGKLKGTVPKEGGNGIGVDSQQENNRH